MQHDNLEITDLLIAAGADVLHLGQDDLPVGWARKIVGDDVVIGRSSHSTADTVSKPGTHSDDHTDSDLQTYLLPHVDDGWTSP